MNNYSKIVNEAWEQATQDGDGQTEQRFYELTQQFTTSVTDWHAIAIEAGMVKPDSPEFIGLAAKTYDADALLRNLLAVQPTVAKMGDLRCGYCGRAVEGIALFEPKAHSDTCRWNLARLAVEASDEALRQEAERAKNAPANERMIVLQVLDGDPLTKVAKSYGITRSKVERLFTAQVTRACLFASKQLDNDVTRVTTENARTLVARRRRYDWVVSDGALYGNRIVTRARSENEIVTQALNAYWFSQAETNP